MQRFHEASVGIAIATIIGLLVNAAIGAARGRLGASHPLFIPVLKCEVWAFLWNMIAMQLVTFSAFFISGWAIEVSQRGMFLPINEGLFSTEGGLGLFLVRCWFYAFAGQLIRDFAVVGCTNSMIAAHHIVCLIGICLMLASPCGGVLMASGPYFLELGSMVYKCVVRGPDYAGGSLCGPWYSMAACS